MIDCVADGLCEWHPEFAVSSQDGKPPVLACGEHFVNEVVRQLQAPPVLVNPV